MPNNDRLEVIEFQNFTQNGRGYWGSKRSWTQPWRWRRSIQSIAGFSGDPYRAPLCKFDWSWFESMAEFRRLPTVYPHRAVFHVLLLSVTVIVPVKFYTNWAKPTKGNNSLIFGSKWYYSSIPGGISASKLSDRLQVVLILHVGLSNLVQIHRSVPNKLNYWVF